MWPLPLFVCWFLLDVLMLTAASVSPTLVPSAAPFQSSGSPTRPGRPTRSSQDTPFPTAHQVEPPPSLGAQITITACDASSQGDDSSSSRVFTCEYAYENPDISSWAAGRIGFVLRDRTSGIIGNVSNHAWLTLYLDSTTGNKVASFSYRHRYIHTFDMCLNCNTTANKDIRVTLSNGYTEDFTLLHEDGSQYFNLTEVNANISWVNISVLSVYGDQMAVGASDIRFFAGFVDDAANADAPTIVPTLEIEVEGNGSRKSSNGYRVIVIAALGAAFFFCIGLYALVHTINSRQADNAVTPNAHLREQPMLQRPVQQPVQQPVQRATPVIPIAVCTITPNTTVIEPLEKPEAVQITN
jgi:hypothetical protein